MRAKCRRHERRKPMNDKMTPDKERENCPCRKSIINPFDAMMMVVVAWLVIRKNHLFGVSLLSKVMVKPFTNRI